MSRRIVCWFSCGAASAVATAITLAEHPDAIVVRNIVREEHPDNDRFAQECEDWFGKPITNLINERYDGSIYNVFEKRRYIAGIAGAPCTMELKKRVREEWQRPTDIHVFGYTAEEVHRYDRILDANNDLDVRVPLIDQNITHADCLAIVERQGIELPAMYKLGYKNNNCIGCVKGGAGYWNKIRRDFPEVFQRMADLERKLGAKLVRERGVRIQLHDLDPATGNYRAEEEVQCGYLCELVDRRLHNDV